MAVAVPAYVGVVGKGRDSVTAQAWRAAFGPREDRLAIVANLDASPEALAAVAPGYQAPGDVELIVAVLAHPHVPVGVVARYATHPDAHVRARVAEHERAPGTALHVLALDRDEHVRHLAADRLAHQPSTPRPCGDTPPTH